MSGDKRTIAFVCPSCRQTVVAERTGFALAASHSRLPCPCGKSAVEVEPMGDQMALDIPCPVCGGSHRGVCPARDFLQRRAMCFTCTASGVETCVVGEEDQVFAAARRMEATIARLDASGEDRGVFLDEIVMQEVLSELKEIADRDGISCTCGSRKWTCKVGYSAVQLTCAQCGGVLRIPAGCADDIDDICCADRLVIRGRDQKD